MKNIIFYTIAITFLLILGSCGKDFLDTQNLFEKTQDNFYATQADVDQALAAAYASMALPHDFAYDDPLLLAELLSDDRFGAGGNDDPQARGIDEFKWGKETQFDGLWENYYQGIFRTNMLIDKMDDAKYDSDKAKKQAIGEAHFLRAYFYSTLAKFYGQVPLITDPAEYNVPKARPEELYALIASDFKIAINNLPAETYSSYANGHATKWAAEALMARTFLFYTGYYGKDNMPTVDGSITKQQVITWLVDCIDHSGHSLVSDFRDLWPYSYATDDYTYAADNGLDWVGDSYASNPENMFSIKFSPFSDWGDGYGAHFVLYQGVREGSGLDYSSIFGPGWGYATVNPQIWDSYEVGDVRKEGSILDVTNANEGTDVTDNYEAASDLWEETGYWQKKYTPIFVQHDGDWMNMYNVLWGGNDGYMGNMQDEVVVRFADVLLMAAELGAPNAQQYFDMVRTRAGLASKPVTLDNIKEERHHELAFEGIRYFDLLRWHDAETAFAKVKNIPIKNGGADAVYNAVFKKETGGFIGIPPTQIRLSGGVLEQNPGW